MFKTIKYYSEAIVGLLACVAIITGLAFCAPAHGAGARVFGTGVVVTNDECLEPVEVLAKVAANQTVELIESFTTDEELAAIEAWWSARKIVYDMARMDVFLDSTRPLDVYVVFYTQIEGKVCADHGVAEDGSEGFYMTAERLKEWKSEVWPGTLTNGIEVTK